ncbi:MAG: hypothetical protein SGJ04_03915 [Bacteroidota bacterium]|nr:hypothetical protein [Bacteroidota bacterium]
MYLILNIHLKICIKIGLILFCTFLSVLLNGQDSSSRLEFNTNIGIVMPSNYQIQNVSTSFKLNSLLAAHIQYQYKKYFINGGIQNVAIGYITKQSNFGVINDKNGNLKSIDYLGRECNYVNAVTALGYTVIKKKYFKLSFVYGTGLNWCYKINNSSFTVNKEDLLISKSKVFGFNESRSYFFSERQFSYGFDIGLFNSSQDYMTIGYRYYNFKSPNITLNHNLHTIELSAHFQLRHRTKYKLKEANPYDPVWVLNNKNPIGVF